MIVPRALENSAGNTTHKATNGGAKAESGRRAQAERLRPRQLRRRAGWGGETRGSARAHHSAEG